MRDFTPVSRDTIELYRNSYGCQNILLNEVTRLANGKLSKIFPHGYQPNDHVCSAYSDRMFCEAYYQLTRETQPLDQMTAKELMSFGEKLIDGRIPFIGDFSKHGQLTAFRAIRYTDVSSGFPCVLYLFLIVQPENLKEVLAYREEKQSQAEMTPFYHVDGYGHVTERKPSERHDCISIRDF